MPLKLLLVEDDHTMLALLGTLLRFEGFEVLQPRSEDDSIFGILKIIRQEKPALVLLDVHLRQFNGLDLLHQIRQEQELAGLRVIMSSGMDVSERCREAGADDFILKPYMPDDLIKRIRDTIAKDTIAKE
jgi:DNA-binding response OmpR family regulator